MHLQYPVKDIKKIKPLKEREKKNLVYAPYVLFTYKKPYMCHLQL